MISQSSGSSGGHHGDPADNAITASIIACTSGNRSNHSGYLSNLFATGHHTPNALIITSSQISVNPAYITIILLLQNDF